MATVEEKNEQFPMATVEEKNEQFPMATVEEKNEQFHGQPKVQRMSFVSSALAGMMNYLKIKIISLNSF
jgi:stress-induced morphogen